MYRVFKQVSKVAHVSGINPIYLTSPSVLLVFETCLYAQTLGNLAILELKAQKVATD